MHIRYSALLILSVLVAAMSPAVRAQEAPAPADAEEGGAEFEPLLLDGGTSLDIDADPDLDLGDAGTIEFWVAAIWDDDDGVSHHPCVLGRREPYEGDELEGFAAATRYSIHITPDRGAIGMFDGVRWESVDFDFSDGQLHHVVLATQGDRTQVHIDGNSSGILAVGYGSGRDLPLHIGSADGGSEFFVGVIPLVRLWRGALSGDRLRELADLIGPPEDDHPAAPNLVAFSEFTAASKELVILGPSGPEDAPAP